MRFVHQFDVDTPLEEVAAFHSQSASMAKITPPPLRVEMHNAPVRLTSGTDLSFSMRVGPLAIPWQAHIPYVGPTGFVDTQVAGIFKKWEHRHIFVPNAAGTTTVVDDVQVQLSRNPVKYVMGASMWMGMPILFRFRAWMTQRILNRRVEGYDEPLDLSNSSA